VGSRTSVFVGKLGMHVTDDMLAAMFSHLGMVVSAKVNRSADKKTDCWGYVGHVLLFRFRWYSHNMVIMALL
jgi:hypothetical protein